MEELVRVVRPKFDLHAMNVERRAHQCEFEFLVFDVLRCHVGVLR